MSKIHLKHLCLLLVLISAALSGCQNTEELDWLEGSGSHSDPLSPDYPGGINNPNNPANPNSPLNPNNPANPDSPENPMNPMNPASPTYNNGL
ncbi:hypothetical protein [Ruficoccus sp. ZRK36]|uniref:hypothetical protein n=1 Tax=Ruficoccus sp. ZRK36 TaxID=2866311 RepID=UPI001C731BA8|nr:hypothetical protein [Ruficoccus sp. ZRK36]QYY36040.1 hypothetical protein K0V07_00890 [Ruficoccus sp. ZRK36]